MMIATTNSLVNGLIPSTRVKPLVRDLLLVALGVALLAVSAQFKTPMPLTPTPVTMQLLVVFMIGSVFGSRLGAVTVLAYIAQGMAVSPFIPWFATGGSALYPFFAPTAGYLWGFVVAAYVVGLCAERQGMRDNAFAMFGAMMLGVALCYGAGLAYAALYFYPVTLADNTKTFQEIWVTWAQSFLFVDTLKAAIASGLTVLAAKWIGSLRA